jgi:hypothetical protein
MKRQIITAVFLLTATMFLNSCGSKNTETQKENTVTEQTEVTMYQCPMKCEGEKMYNDPGQCPVCKMDLEMVEEMHDDHEGHDHN